MGRFIFIFIFLLAGQVSFAGDDVIFSKQGDLNLRNLPQGTQIILNEPIHIPSWASEVDFYQGKCPSGSSDCTLSVSMEFNGDQGERTLAAPFVMEVNGVGSKDPTNVAIGVDSSIGFLFLSCGRFNDRHAVTLSDLEFALKAYKPTIILPGSVSK